MDSRNTPLYRFSKVVYFILGIPFWLGLFFGIYLWITEEFVLPIFIGLLIYLILVGGLKYLAKYIILGPNK